jgi:hypothetical protein
MVENAGRNINQSATDEAQQLVPTNWDKESSLAFRVCARIEMPEG